MKKEIRSWFDELDYEEGFGPGEAPLNKVRKRRIGTYAIVSVATKEERKEIFDEVPIFLYFTCVFSFCR